MRSMMRIMPLRRKRGKKRQRSTKSKRTRKKNRRSTCLPLTNRSISSLHHLSWKRNNSRTLSHPTKCPRLHHNPRSLMQSPNLNHKPTIKKRRKCSLSSTLTRTRYSIWNKRWGI